MNYKKENPEFHPSIKTISWQKASKHFKNCVIKSETTNTMRTFNGQNEKKKKNLTNFGKKALLLIPCLQPFLTQSQQVPWGQ